MRVLYLSYDGLTDPLGQSQILPYLKGLVTLDYSFTIISFEKKERNDQIIRIREELDELGIEWVPLNYHKDPPVFSTLYDLRKLRKTARRVLKTNDFDVVHCRSYITSIVGQELKLQYGISFIFDMRGYWADERVEGKIWDMKNPIFKYIYEYFKIKEQQFLKNADRVIVLTQQSRLYLSDKYGNKNITVIPCCVNTNHFIPSDSNSYDGPYIGYIGSLRPWYLLDQMIEFFQVFSETAPNYKWLIITRDDTTLFRERMIHLSLSFEKVKFVKSDYSEVPKWLSKIDATMVFIRPVFSETARFPTKLGESLAMNVPVVVNRGSGDIEGIVESSELGVFVTEFNRKGYKSAAEELKKLIKREDKNARSWVEKNLSINQGIELYKKVYENCTGH